MKKFLHMIAVLGLAGVVSGAALVFMYRYARPQIENNQLRTKERAIYTVLPEARDYKTIVRGGKEIYQGIGIFGKIVGYAFVAEGEGYQGNIRIMVGMNSNLDRLAAIEILYSVETPGLGGLISSDSFKAQFQGLSVSPQIHYVKNKKPERPNEIQAITGATVSSSAVVKILNREIAKVKSLLLKSNLR